MAEEKEEMTAFNLYLPKKLAERLRAYWKREGVNMSKVAQIGIKKELDEREGKK